MKNGSFDDEFSIDEEYILFLNLDTGERIVYKGSQLKSNTPHKEYEDMEFILRAPNIVKHYWKNMTQERVKSMWMVWSKEEGLIITTNDREKAEKEYEESKKWYKDTFDDEFTTDEHVILAKVESQFYSEDTGETVYEEDEDGNKIPTKDTYWDWREKTY